jgi:hypothetical protein
MDMSRLFVVIGLGSASFSFSAAIPTKGARVTAQANMKNGNHKITIVKIRWVLIKKIKERAPARRS